MESIRINDLKLSRVVYQELLDALPCITESEASLGKIMFWITHSYGSPVTSSDKTDQT